MGTQSYGNKRERTELEKILEKGGGLYRSFGKGSVTFTVYTDVHYAGLDTGSRGFSIGLTLRSPPGPGRDPSASRRLDYWQHAGSKRLTSGSLVALVLVSRGSSKAYLANLVSSADDIAKSAKFSADYIQVNATFFDPQVEIEALREASITVDTNTFALLIDNGVMFESVRPFLKTLSGVDSSSIPFSRYICTQDPLRHVAVRPPMYTTAPEFRFQLQSVAKAGQTIDPLDVNNPESVARARAQLKQVSVLDPSQADSVVDALTREVSLIQGLVFTVNFPEMLLKSLPDRPERGRWGLLNTIQIHTEDIVLELYGKGTLSNSARQQDQTDRADCLHKPRIGPHVELYSRRKYHGKHRQDGVLVNR